MNNRVLWAAVITTVVVAVVAAGTYLRRDEALRGSVIEPPMAAPDFVLSGFDGEPFRLSEQRGRVVLIFFGYTNCAEECPLAMANLKLATEGLGDEVGRTRVVLITTDPERDSPEALQVFLRKFDARFSGLTGSRQDLDTVWRDYGVTVMDGGETHSNYIYVIDRSGALAETFLADSSPAEMAADIRVLLRRD